MERQASRSACSAISETTQWTVGDRIWRKDVVGHPGRIYEHGGQIHFKICLNETNLQALIGRVPAWVETCGGAHSRRSS